MTVDKSPLVPVDKHGREASQTSVLLLVVLAGGGYSLSGIPMTLMIYIGPGLSADIKDFSPMMLSLCQSVFFVGYAIAALAIMPYTDRIGRRKPLYFLLGATVVAGFLGACATTVGAYGTTLFIIGLVYPPSYAAGYLLMQESVSDTMRPKTLVACNVNYCLCQIAMAILSYNLQDLSWRMQTLLWYSLFMVLLVTGPFYIRESPKFEAALTNKEPSQNTGSFTDQMRELLRGPLRANMCATLVCWIAVTFGFFGLSYSAGNLSPNLYVNMSLLAAVDLVAYALGGPILSYFESRRVQTFAFVAGSMALLCSSFLLAGTWPAIAFTLAGRLFLDVAFTTVYLILVDCFPLKIRSAAMGVANFVCRLFAFGAPFLANLPIALTCQILSVLCLFAAAATTMLTISSQEVYECAPCNFISISDDDNCSAP